MVLNNLFIFLLSRFFVVRFSLAYQYRFTFLPRILFAMRFRTIGFCCGWCGCNSPCCTNQDSLNDPCGSQYSTLSYLLRKQRPVILYANFIGAFHRGIRSKTNIFVNQLVLFFF
jgi:hypothetical protein